jgi:hypothetical protein
LLDYCILTISTGSNSSMAIRKIGSCVDYLPS